MNLCLNDGSYAEHIYALTREICERYEQVDGLFVRVELVSLAVALRDQLVHQAARQVAEQIDIAVEVPEGNYLRVVALDGELELGVEWTRCGEGF